MRRLPNGVMAITVALVLYVVYLGTKKDPLRDDKGNMILRHNKIYIILGAVAIPLVPILINNFLFSGYPESRDYLIGGFLSATLLLLGVFLIMSYINERTVVGSESIEYRNIFRNNVSIAWKDIKEFRHNPSIRKLVLITDKGAVGINTNFIGFKAFEEELIKHTEPATDDNIKGIL